MDFVKRIFDHKYAQEKKKLTQENQILHDKIKTYSKNNARLKKMKQKAWEKVTKNLSYLDFEKTVQDLQTYKDIIEKRELPWVTVIYNIINMRLRTQTPYIHGMESKELKDTLDVFTKYCNYIKSETQQKTSELKNDLKDIDFCIKQGIIFKDLIKIKKDELNDEIMDRKISETITPLKKYIDQGEEAIIKKILNLEKKLDEIVEKVEAKSVRNINKKIISDKDIQILIWIKDHIDEIELAIYVIEGIAFFSGAAIVELGVFHLLKHTFTHSTKLSELKEVIIGMNKKLEKVTIEIEQAQKIAA